jgi:prevent-host-death family protein
MPLTEHECYDLALGVGGQLLLVQCKWARKVESVVIANLARNRRGPDGFIRRNYSAEAIDAFDLYCGELDECFLIPIDLVDGQWSLQLRLGPTRNGQRAALHFAEEYRLGAVAQLAERSDGIRKAEGSNPSSSTNQNTCSEPTSEDVGAHKFRNRFGYYMEQAAAGTEILIRRRGKPYARLGPAKPPA